MYDGELNQAWLRLWTHHCPESQLARHLKPRREETVTVLDRRTLRHILEDAPRYFDAISELRTVSWDDYRLFAQIGCVMPALDDRCYLAAQLPLDERYPSIMASISLGKHWWDHNWKSAEEKAGWARVMIFKRVANGPFVPWGDLFYEWIDVAVNKTLREQWGGACYLGVDTSRRKARVLAEPSIKPQALPRGGLIHHYRVGLPHYVTGCYRDFADEYSKEHDGKPCPDRSVHEYATTLLALTMSEWRSVDKAWQVHLEKDRIEMRICVPERSAVQFFKDRDIEDGEHRRRRPIFHIVSGHERILPSGRVTEVREHYRGNRVFDWNGYNVLITVPGHHHGKLSTFESDAWLADYGPLPERRMVSMPTLGAVIHAAVRGARPSQLHSYRRGW